MDANSIPNNVRRFCERASFLTTEAQTTVEQGNGNVSGRRIAYKAALQSQTPGTLGEGVQNPLLLPTSSTDVKRLFSRAMSHVRSSDTTGSPDGTFQGEGASITTWGPRTWIPCHNVPQRRCGGRRGRANNLAPTTSALAIMALGDALAVCLIKARDFKPSDFAQFHPGGMLGRRLLSRVGDVMITENLPLISPKETVREAIFCMTSGRLGLAIIVKDNQLQGILTDGDLRRALIMDPTMMDKPVQEFMTPVPVTISANAMVSDAEVLMRKYKIRALIVTDAREGAEDSVCGLLEIFADN